MKTKMMKNSLEAIHVVIPAYNEEESVGMVVEELGRLDLDLVIWVVDDGSRDATSEEADKAGARVVRHSVNIGQWGALRTGFMLALLDGAEIIVSIDADGQHDPKDLPRLIDAFYKEKADLVIASRFFYDGKPEMLRHRRLGIRFFNKLLKIIFRYELTDCTNGFKVYKAELIKKVLPKLKEAQYGALEFLIKATKQDALIMEIPIKSVSNIQSSKGRVKYGYNLFRTIIKSLFD